MSTKCVLNKSTLAGIAKSIRAKGGTSGLLKPSEMAKAVDDIKTGGGGETEAESKDVNFYHPDGRRLFSYTIEEARALTALPDVPDWDGFTANGWTHELPDVLAVRDGEFLDVVAEYTPADGATHIAVTVPDEPFKTMRLIVYQTVANGTEIDWGDGTGTEVVAKRSSDDLIEHTYAAAGDYDIKVKVVSGTAKLGPSSSGAYGGIFGADTSGYPADHGKVARMVRGIAVGTGITEVANLRYAANLKWAVLCGGLAKTDDYMFYGCSTLRVAVVPHGVATVGGYSFQFTPSLMAVVIPPSATKLDWYAFNYAGPCRVILPEGMAYGPNAASCQNSMLTEAIVRTTAKGDSLFSGCGGLKRAVLPNTATELAERTFYGCYSLENATLPDGITTIPAGTFSNCYLLQKVVVPGSVTTIASQAFLNCKSLRLMDFREATVVPSLANTMTVYSIPSDAKIVVPDGLYEDWKTATNWSTHASKIVKASEYTEE